jgi:tetratricopeptide (TPR) repeat protein
MSTSLIVRYIGLDGQAHRFSVTRARDNKAADPVTVPSPVGFPVEGQSVHDLMQELRWYLESFLRYPFPPETFRAERLLAARQEWGRVVFEALFHAGKGRDFYHDATREPDALHLEIHADDPGVLAWPWEALQDIETNHVLALQGRIERRIGRAADPPPLSNQLPRDRVRILLVIARPYERDVGFRSIARPLIEQIEKQGYAAEVTVLRPPTFEHLQDVLEANPNTFHILHFDGHGGYGSIAEPDGHTLGASQGQLVFEDAKAKPHLVDASTLGELLQRHRLPAVVLNACRSAMLGSQEDQVFASVATSLLNAGIRSVVAMAYSLYLTGAQEFLPAFYRSLFKTGDIGRATQDGRRKMRENPGRICARGLHPLEDWVIPVLYQQDRLDLTFAMGSTWKPPALPQDTIDEANPYAMIGRDGPLLELERAMRREPAGILIHGLGGIGKTTLARGFVHWLAQTGGLGERLLWVDFRDVRSAEYVVDTMLGRLVSSRALALSMEAKAEELSQLLRGQRATVVWDNFESVRGIEGTPTVGQLSTADQQVLAGFLHQLRGGISKVLLTSRSDEAWLGNARVPLRPLEGLHDEERWEFCERILADLGLDVDREDPEQVALMERLGGHPLLMRAVLPKLATMTARGVREAVETNLAALGGSADELHAKAMATLRFVEDSLPDDLRPLRVPLSLHEHFVVPDDLEAMAEAAEPGRWSRATVERFLDALSVAGLLTRRGPVFELHPALTTYLRAQTGEIIKQWESAFVNRMGMASRIVPHQSPQEQRRMFAVYDANFRRALELAKRHLDIVSAMLLTISLATYAQGIRTWADAELMYKELAGFTRQLGNRQGEAGAYYNLGRLAEEQQDREAAEHWYLKSLAICETDGNNHGMAITYQQLGMIAYKQRDFETAELWSRKSLSISEQRSDERGITRAYHHLGMVAQAQKDLVTAERWYMKSLAISEPRADEAAAAGTYHHLGMIAQELLDFMAAECWYMKSIAISEKLGNEHEVTIAYHQLGNIALQREDFVQAEHWYMKSLFIKERQGDEHEASITYHQLGRVAEERRDFVVAECWYMKSLAISEKRSNERQAAITYHQLGCVELARKDLTAAECWHMKSLAIKERLGDEYSAAATYHQLGVIAEERQDFEAAENWHRKSLTIVEAFHDEYLIAIAKESLVRLENPSQH